MLKSFFFILPFLSFFSTSAQRGFYSKTNNTLKIDLNEGDTLKLNLSEFVRANCDWRISHDGNLNGIEIDSMGVLYYIADYQLVPKGQKNKVFHASINSKCHTLDSREINLELVVKDKNRPPVLYNIPVLYVKYDAENSFRINFAEDPDGDLLVYQPNMLNFLQGMDLSIDGKLTWKPTENQFEKLRKDGFLEVDFFVEDLPAKSYTKGKIIFKPTETNFAPQLKLIPNQSRLVVYEDQTLNVSLWVSDPNGLSDIKKVGFLSSSSQIVDSVLQKEDALQYLFSFSPNYDFVGEKQDSITIKMTFYAVDNQNETVQQDVDMIVKNVIDLDKYDKELYRVYYSTLQEAYDLISDLIEKEEQFKNQLKKARKGKKHRSLVNASLGATTGLSPILAKGSSDTQRLITSIGGTTVLTLGTLEATEVIGRPLKDINERLNYLIEKKNEVQTNGDAFARSFNNRILRRKPQFIQSVEKMDKIMNLSGLVALELNAIRKNERNITEKELRKEFKDFSVF